MNDTSKEKTIPSEEDLSKLVRQHMVAAFAAGLVPVPLMDIAVMSGVQLNLVRKVAACYDVPFSRNAVKSIICALAGGVAPAYAAPPLASLAKAIPFAGTALGIVTMPTMSAAMTYAVGHVFIQHFASGGTLLSFDAEKAAGLFKGLFKKGEEQAVEMAEEGDAAKESEEAERMASVNDEPTEDVSTDEAGEKETSPKKKKAKKRASSKKA
jgi:uncharacterized protein (DUF697 family)